MRKLLFIILDVLLLIGAGYIIVKGFELGDFEIWGFENISNESKALKEENDQLSELVSTKYTKTLNELDETSRELARKKEDYEDKSVSVSNNRYYMQTEKYEIEYLWTRLGNYAKDNNVLIKIDVVNSATSGVYDLNFAIAGAYADVTDFIYDIENDSKLGFKIEDFHMFADGDGVQGTFACKEISINIEEIDQSVNETIDTEENENTDNATQQKEAKTRSIVQEDNTVADNQTTNVAQ